MNTDIKENVKNVDVWIRGLFIIIFGVILYFVFGIIWLLVVFQFLTKVFTGELNLQLANFSKRSGRVCRGYRCRIPSS